MRSHREGHELYNKAKHRQHFANDPEVILTPRKFRKIATPGQIYYCVITCNCEPSFIDVVHFFKWKDNFKDWFVDRRYKTHRNSVNDKFRGEKCICLTREKAEEVLLYLKECFQKISNGKK